LFETVFINISYIVDAGFVLDLKLYFYQAFVFPSAMPKIKIPASAITTPTIPTRRQVSSWISHSSGGACCCSSGAAVDSTGMAVKEVSVVFIDRCWGANGNDPEQEKDDSVCLT
jgi:hypothetical protein